MPLISSQSPNYKKNQGFTLLEVLISLAVLSVGLLGLAGMEMFGNRYTHDAYLRTRAVTLAYDMIDRMRSNMSAVNDPAQASWPNRKGQYDDVNKDTKPASSPDCESTSTACSSSDLAKYDAYQWLTKIEGELPEGTGSLNRIAANSEFFKLTISWTTRKVDQSAGADNDPEVNQLVLWFRPWGQNQ